MRSALRLVGDLVRAGASRDTLDLAAQLLAGIRSDLERLSPA